MQRRKLIALGFVLAGSAALGVMSTVNAAGNLKVGLVLDRGGRDDKSFNSAAVRGVVQAEKELGIENKIVEATDDNSYEPALKNFADKKFDLVIAVGFKQADALKKVAPKFPNTKFAIVDSEVEGNNVRSLMFEEHEGSFLVGALAAMKSTSGKVGFVGGMDIPLIRRFQMGYEAGAKHINPKAEVVNGYVGTTGEAWNNPPKAKEITLSQIGSGADIVFAAAGGSGLGVFDAIEEKKKLAIGVDSNQNGVKPGLILTSMVKKVEVGVFNTVKDLKDGKFSNGTVRYGLKNGGVDFSMDEFNAKLVSKDQLDKLNQIKADIIAGKIQVPDFYKKK